MGLQHRQGGFGQAAVGGDLAAEDGQERGGSGGGVEFEDVVSCGFLRGGGTVVEEGADAGIAPDRHIGGDLFAEVGAGGAAEVFDFIGAGADARGVAFEVEVGGADERKILLVGDQEEDAAVGVLEDVAGVVVVELAHDDVAALDQPDRRRHVGADDRTGNLRHPGAGRIDQGAGTNFGVVFERDQPVVFVAFGGDAGGSWGDCGSPFGGVPGVQDDQTRIFHPAIGVFEAFGELGFEDLAGRVGP